MRKPGIAEAAAVLTFSLALSAGIALACECDEGILRTVAPGKRMGHVTLGEKRSVVRKHLGPPARTFTLPGGRTSDLWRYGTRENGVNPPTLEVIYEKGRAVQAETTNSEFVTQSGLGIYSETEQWRKEVGKPRLATYTYSSGKPRQMYQDWHTRGVALEVQLMPTQKASNSTIPGYNEKVQTLIIHRPGVAVIPDVDGTKVR